MGEAQHTLFGLDFNRSIVVEGRPERLSGDAGALLVREVFSRLSLEEFFARRLEDPRDPALIVHPQIELLRTSLVLAAQGWRDQDDADRLRDDPILRLAVSQRSGIAPLESPAEGSRLPDGLASQPTLSRFHASLSSARHRAVLRQGLLEAAARRVQASRGHRLRYATLDVDSLPMEVHGHQEGAEYNGHFGAVVYHPLMAAIAETGDLVDVRLRRGRAHTAEGALSFILPLLDRLEARYCQVASVRIDAGFPEEELLAALETRNTPYVCRIRSNARLQALAEPYLHRPVGRPPAEPRMWLHELSYRAASWTRERRVVLVVKEIPGELFLDSFFLLTSWPAEQMPADALLEIYRQRGTAEGHLGELMNVLDPALSSTRRPKSHYQGQEPVRRYGSVEPFAVNEVRLLLAALAYNLVHAARLLLERLTHRGWGLRSFLEQILRLPARVILHARYAVVVLNRTQAALWSRLWSQLKRFRWLPPPQPCLS